MSHPFSLFPSIPSWYFFISLFHSSTLGLFSVVFGLSLSRLSPFGILITNISCLPFLNNNNC